MAKTKQSPEIEIEVGGEPYLWWLHRRPQGSSVASERRGMAIGVRHAEGRREAVLEFPPGPQLRIGAPLLQAAQISRQLVATAIASALEAGWEPLSRGKTVEIVVDAEGR
jgi:hypothetical protein